MTLRTQAISTPFIRFELMEDAVPLRESGPLQGLPFPTLSESNRQHIRSFPNLAGEVSL